jgi:succinoglycan biosynthesis transport protein ExoP
MTAAMAVLGRIEVSRGSGNIIEIEAHSLNPERAAQLANAVVESYIEEQLSSRYQTARQAGGWLQDRIQELAHQTSIADEAVAKFKTKKNIVAAGGRLLSEQQLGELNTQLTVSREKTNEMRARLDRILAITNSDFDNQIVGTVAETLNNPIIVKLRSQYLELAAREADWAGRFGRDHQAVVNLTRQLREISAAIADELRRIAETYKSDYEIAKQRQANLEVAVAETAAHFQEATEAQIELRQLESAAETYRTLHRSALQRSTELVQQQSFPGTAARLITRASAPSGKSGPKTAIILLASTAGGMMFGLGIAVMRVSLDRGFRTPSQVEADLQASCLGLIPTLKGSRRKKSSRPAAPRTIVAGANVSWGVVERPLSRFAEAMRSIRSAAGLASQPIKVLGFTSSLPNEGKSTTAAAFALLVAQTGARVVLVDCDLRNPALSRLFAPGGTQGLFEVISGKTPLDEALWTEPATKLSFLPGAMKSPVPDSAEIMASSALHSFFEELRNKFDCVVVDLPPVAPIVDVRSTANLIDAYVFIVEWGRTKRDVVDLALRKAPAVYENLLGVVLNKVDLKKVCRYDGHRSEYYSDRTYARYEDGQV